MKILLAALGAIASAVVAVVFMHPATPNVVDPPIKVIAGPDRSPVPTWNEPSGITAIPGARFGESGTALPTNEIVSDNAPPNEVRADETFAAQTRDPVWAGKVEADIAPLLPSGGAITCADYVCKVSVPFAENDGMGGGGGVEKGADIAEQRAVLLTRDWPRETAYNSQTARIEKQDQSRSLTFFVTRDTW